MTFIMQMNQRWEASAIYSEDLKVIIVLRSSASNLNKYSKLDFKIILLSCEHSRKTITIKYQVYWHSERYATSSLTTDRRSISRYGTTMLSDHIISKSWTKQSHISSLRRIRPRKLLLYGTINNSFARLNLHTRTKLCQHRLKTSESYSLDNTDMPLTSGLMQPRQRNKDWEKHLGSSSINWIIARKEHS